MRYAIAIGILVCVYVRCAAGIGIIILHCGSCHASALGGKPTFDEEESCPCDCFLLWFGLVGVTAFNHHHLFHFVPALCCLL
jgi:hypothetical protein